MASNGGAAWGGTSWRWIGRGTAAALLLVPLIARFPWTLSDYVFAAVLFALVGGGFELAVRASSSGAYRGGVAVALAASFLLIWLNAAVGIIGNEDNPANLMFFVVILIALAGAIVARFRADGMARAMAVAAIAQGLVAAIAFIGHLGAHEPPGPGGVVMLIGAFAAMWALSAWLFRRAAAAGG